MSWFRNKATGGVRLTEPQDMEGWDRIDDPAKLSRGDRLAIRIEEIDAASKALEVKLRKEFDERFASTMKPPNGGENKQEPASLRKIIQGVSTGDWKGAEYERSILVPVDGRARALDTTVDASGGYVVPPEYLPGQFIEMLRANAISYQLPTTNLDGLTSSPIMIGSQTGAATAYWTAENASITASSQTFGQKTMQPHGLKALTPMSNRILRLASPSAESIVQNDLAAVLGLELSRAFIYGTGASGEPIGVYQTTGITSQTTAATITPTSLWGMVAKVEAGNVPVDSSAAFCMNPSKWHSLRTNTSVIQAGINRTATGVAPMLTKDLGGIPIFTSTQIATANVLFGVWRHAIVGRWGGLELMASQHAGNAFQYDQTYIRAVMDVDFCFRQPTAFCRETNVTA